MTTEQERETAQGQRIPRERGKKIFCILYRKIPKTSYLRHDIDTCCKRSNIDKKSFILDSKFPKPSPVPKSRPNFPNGGQREEDYDDSDGHRIGKQGRVGKRKLGSKAGRRSQDPSNSRGLYEYFDDRRDFIEEDRPVVVRRIPKAVIKDDEDDVGEELVAVGRPKQPILQSRCAMLISIY